MHVALFDVTISNCCSKGIIGGIISFRDKQCIMNYNQNNSFADNTLALGAQKNVKQLIKDGKVILSVGEISTSEQRVDIYIKMTCFGKTILEQSYSWLTIKDTPTCLLIFLILCKLKTKPNGSLGRSTGRANHCEH